MGLPPIPANETRPRRHPRESGGPFSVRNTMDSRLRGNDVICGGAGSDEGSLQELQRSFAALRMTANEGSRKKVRREA